MGDDSESGLAKYLPWGLAVLLTLVVYGSLAPFAMGVLMADVMASTGGANVEMLLAFHFTGIGLVALGTIPAALAIPISSRRIPLVGGGLGAVVLGVLVFVAGFAFLTG